MQRYLFDPRWQRLFPFLVATTTRASGDTNNEAGDDRQTTNTRRCVADGRDDKRKDVSK